MEAMKKKGLQWVDQLKTHPLPSRDVWLGFHHQLYPSMAYGLASVVLSPSKLEKLVRGVYFHALPLLGVNRCITTEWTMLPPRYLPTTTKMMLARHRPLPQLPLPRMSTWTRMGHPYGDENREAPLKSKRRTEMLPSASLSAGRLT